MWAMLCLNLLHDCTCAQLYSDLVVGNTAMDLCTCMLQLILIGRYNPWMVYTCESIMTVQNPCNTALVLELSNFLIWKLLSSIPSI